MANEGKSAFLGMPFGTANHQLRKKILFSLVQKLELDICFRCDQKIESVDVLSIEHKEPWEGRENGVALFWDLENIAFSHLKCNIGTGIRHPEILRDLNISNRKIGPEGTGWCYKGKHYVSINKFFPDRNHWNGLSNECRECRNERRTPKLFRDSSIGGAGGC